VSANRLDYMNTVKLLINDGSQINAQTVRTHIKQIRIHTKPRLKASLLMFYNLTTLLVLVDDDKGIDSNNMV